MDGEDGQEMAGAEDRHEVDLSCGARRTDWSGEVCRHRAGVAQAAVRRAAAHAVRALQ